MREGLKRAAASWRTGLLLTAGLAMGMALSLLPAEPVRASHGSMRFKPSVVSLGQVGLSATITMEGIGTQAMVNQIVIVFLHDALFKFESPRCVGAAEDHGQVQFFPGATATEIRCNIIEGKRVLQGDLITFKLTALNSFTGDKTIRMDTVQFWAPGNVLTTPDIGNELTIKPRLGVNLAGKLSLQYGGETPGIIRVSVACPSLTATVSPNGVGDWIMPSVPPEACTLRAAAPGYLPAERQVQVGSQDVTLPNAILLWGDADGNGIVNIHDITGLVANFGKGGPQPW